METIKYIHKTWYDKSDLKKRIPISADNLNRIEDGIQEALTKIADTNILYFYGSGMSSPSKWVDFFQLPDDIEFSKYIPLIQVSDVIVYDYLAIAPYDSIVRLYNGGQFKFSSEGLFSFYEDKKYSRSIPVEIMLVPVQKTELTPIS